MRRLMWFTVGFAISCGLLVWAGDVTWMVSLILCVGAAAGSLRWRKLLCAALMLLGCTIGILWFGLFRQQYLLPAMELDGAERELQIIASDYSEKTDYGMVFHGKLSLNDRSYQIRAYLNDDIQLAPGDLVTGSFRLRYTAPSGREEITHHAGKGIFLLAYARGDMEITPRPPEDRSFYPAEWRADIQSILESCFPSDVSPMARGLLLGDTSDIDYRTLTSFSITGIRHVVAVSGLHVSILFGILSVLTLKRRYLTALIGIPVLAMFAATAGFTPSVSRACLMCGLMVLAGLCSREYDGPTALSFSALVLLILNPLVITSVSFQLSCASVAGIFLFHPMLNGWLRRCLIWEGDNPIWKQWKNGIIASLSLTLSATSLTVPLVAWYFGTVSLISPITNLLTLWLISLSFYGIVGVCLLFWLWPGVVALLACITAWLLRLVLWIVELLSGMPLEAVYTASPYITAWLVFVYVLLAVFLLTKGANTGLLCKCAALGLCLALLASWAEPLLWGTRVTVLDVGQGQCILLQSSGKTFLVDCGGDSDTASADLAAQTLLSQGVTRLDGIILTHYDKDHAAGAEKLLSRMDTDLLLLPDTENKASISTSGRTIYVRQDLDVAFEGGKLRIFGPIYSGISNENSLCVLFETEKCVILITGDRSGFGERMLLRKTTLPQVDLLIAGHHGAADSTCRELLEAVRPETVLISAGKDNPYGHPAPELLQRLAEYGCKVFRTDLQGTLVFRR